MCLKNVFYVSVLLLLFSAPVTISAAEPTYQMTDQELTELSMIFEQLESRQKQQEALLTQQVEQLTTLQGQLETSKKQISSSQTEMQKLQTSLRRANQSLQESSDEAKRAHDRLERQRNMWAVVAAIVLGVAVVNN